MILLAVKVAVAFRQTRERFTDHPQDFLVAGGKIFVRRSESRPKAMVRQVEERAGRFDVKVNQRAP